MCRTIIYNVFFHEEQLQAVVDITESQDKPGETDDESRCNQGENLIASETKKSNLSQRCTAEHIVYLMERVQDSG